MPGLFLSMFLAFPLVLLAAPFMGLYTVIDFIVQLFTDVRQSGLPLFEYIQNWYASLPDFATAIEMLSEYLREAFANLF